VSGKSATKQKRRKMWCIGNEAQPLGKKYTVERTSSEMRKIKYNVAKQLSRLDGNES